VVIATVVEQNAGRVAETVSSHVVIRVLGLVGTTHADSKEIRIASKTFQVYPRTARCLAAIHSQMALRYSSSRLDRIISSRLPPSCHLAQRGWIEIGEAVAFIQFTQHSPFQGQNRRKKQYVSPHLLGKQYLPVNKLYVFNE